MTEMGDDDSRTDLILIFFTKKMFARSTRFV